MYDFRAKTFSKLPYPIDNLHIFLLQFAYVKKRIFIDTLMILNELGIKAHCNTSTGRICILQDLAITLSVAIMPKTKTTNAMMTKRIIPLCLAALAIMPAKAQSILIPDAEKKVMQESRERVEEQAKFVSSEKFAEMCQSYRVMKRFSPRIKELLAEREQRKACYNYIYNDSPSKRAKAKAVIDSLYQDSINIRLIPYNKNISGDYVSLALFLDKSLRMDSAQTCAIKQCALDLAHKIKKNPKLDTWPEERKAIVSVLTPKQVEKLLVRKNGKKIANDFRTAWTRLKDAGLAQQLDSVSDGALAVVYFEKTYAIKELYQRDKNARRMAMAQLDKRKPLMIRLLDGLNKKEALEKKETIQQKIGKDFVW